MKIKSTAFELKCFELIVRAPLKKRCRAFFHMNPEPETGVNSYADLAGTSIASNMMKVPILTKNDKVKK